MACNGWGHRHDLRTGLAPQEGVPYDCEFDAGVPLALPVLFDNDMIGGSIVPGRAMAEPVARTDVHRFISATRSGNKTPISMSSWQRSMQA
jgi:hypothetical protein